MAIYIIIASLIFWPGVVKNNKQSYRFAIILLFLMTAFRNWTLGGTDAYIYHNFFLNRADNWVTAFEYGYGYGFTILNVLIRSITNNYYIFQFVYAAITIFLLDRILEKIDISWSEKCILLFTYFCLRFFYNEWIVLRQNMSNLFFWYFALSIYKCDRTKPIKIVLTAIAAIAIPFLFHSSALLNVFLLLVLYGFSKLPFKMKIFVVPAVAISFRMMGGSLLSPLLSFMTTFISDRYAMYAGKEELTSNFIYFILRFMFFGFFCYRYNANTSKSKGMVLDMMSMTIMLGAIDLEIVSRVFEYYSIGLYASAGTLISTFTENNKIVVALIYYVCMLIIMIRFLVTFTSVPFIPFTTCLTGMP